MNSDGFFPKRPAFYQWLILCKRSSYVYNVQCRVTLCYSCSSNHPLFKFTNSLDAVLNQTNHFKHVIYLIIFNQACESSNWILAWRPCWKQSVIFFYALVTVNHRRYASQWKIGLSSGRHVGIWERTMLAFKPEYKHFMGQDLRATEFLLSPLSWTCV